MSLLPHGASIVLWLHQDRHNARCIPLPIMTQTLACKLRCHHNVTIPDVCSSPVILWATLHHEVNKGKPCTEKSGEGTKKRPLSRCSAYIHFLLHACTVHACCRVECGRKSVNMASAYFSPDKGRHSLSARLFALWRVYTGCREESRKC